MFKHAHIFDLFVLVKIINKENNMIGEGVINTEAGEGYKTKEEENNILGPNIRV